MSTLFGQSTISGPSANDQSLVSSSQQPEWFQNQKKRTIPNHLVPKKKTGFHISSSATGKTNKSTATGSRRVASGSLSSKDAGQVTIASKDQFNILSFGSQQRKAVSQGTLDRNSSVGTLFETTGLNDTTRFDDTINESYEDFGSAGDDLPPTRSIYDLNDEVLVSLNKPAQQIDSFINKDPKSFSNVFNRQDDDVEASKNATNVQERRKSINPLTNNESAVLVFGYPESLSPQVILHFKEFGDVLEDFESNQKKYTLVSTKNPQKSVIVPIFSGKNWIKITYDNPGSAVEALQENGTVFNGVLLGVIPYSKHAIEKLQKRRLGDNEDIGGGNISFNDINTTRSEIEKTPIAPESNQASASVSNPTSYISRLDIKDGSQFFLKTEGDQVKVNGNTNEQPLGFFGTISKYVFGFHEL